MLRYHDVTVLLLRLDTYTFPVSTHRLKQQLSVPAPDVYFDTHVADFTFSRSGPVTGP